MVPDLGKVDIFSISERHDFIEGKDDLKGVLQDVGLLQGAAVLGHDPGNMDNKRWPIIQ